MDLWGPQGHLNVSRTDIQMAVAELSVVHFQHLPRSKGGRADKVQEWTLEPE